MRLLISLTQFILVFAASNGSVKAVQETTALFDEVIKSRAFVDKTKLVEQFISGERRHLAVLAPRGFGKTTNLSMLRLFLETSVGLPERVSEMRRQIFLGTRISRNRGFFERHFARYPVIELSFAGLDFRDYDSFRVSLRDFVRRMYADHRYLLSYGQLSENDREDFVNFFESRLDSHADKLIESGGTLSKLLHRRFKRKCIVLMDEYDRPGTTVTFSRINETDSRKILNDTGKFIRSLLGNSSYVGHSLMTGVLNMEEAYSSRANISKYIRIFDDEAIGQWYGLSPEEVHDLAKTRGKSQHFLKKLEYWYCGYSIRESGKNLCITQSIVKFLAASASEREDQAALRHYWSEAPGLEELKQYLRYKVYGEQILPAAQRFHPEPIETSLDFSYARLQTLKLLATQKNNRHALKRQALLQFLIESGYLTLSDKKPASNGKVWIVSPNFETKDVLRKMIETKDYLRYAARNGCLEDARQKVQATFEDWSRSMRVNEKTMTTLARTLNYFFRSAEVSHMRIFMNEVAMILNQDGGSLDATTSHSGEEFTIWVGYRKSRHSTIHHRLFVMTTANNHGTPMDHLRRINNDSSDLRCLLIGLTIDDFGCDMTYSYGNRNLAKARSVSVRNECEEPMNDRVCVAK